MDNGLILMQTMASYAIKCVSCVCFEMLTISTLWHEKLNLTQKYNLSNALLHWKEKKSDTYKTLSDSANFLVFQDFPIFQIQRACAQEKIISTREMTVTQAFKDEL